MKKSYKIILAFICFFAIVLILLMAYDRRIRNDIDPEFDTIEAFNMHFL